MNYEVRAAFVVGLLLPVLETIRRGFGHWAIHTTTMLEDYLAGGLLIAAGLAAVRRTSFAKPLLLAAWASVTAMMTLSLISQIEDTLRASDVEPNNALVLVFKLALWAICSVALWRSFRLSNRSPS